MTDDNQIKPVKGLNKIEKFVCEMIWGNAPVDFLWVRNSKIFIEGMNKFNKGEWRELFDFEMAQLKKKEQAKIS